MITQIIEDTRQQAGKHKQVNNFFRSLGIKVIRDKLYVGDYTLPTDRRICIDVKQDIIEIAGNICGRTTNVAGQKVDNHARFRDECMRAKETGTQLYILIEQNESNGHSITCPEDLVNWSPPVFRFGARKGQPRTFVKGEPLGKAMRTMEIKYGVVFLFCSPEETGQIILELLEGGQHNEN